MTDVTPRQPVNPELFARTAPAWNCVDYPGDGMHYAPAGGDCRWCGATPAARRAELDAPPAGYTPGSPGCADASCRACYPVLRGTGAVLPHQPPVRCLACGDLLQVAWPQGMALPAARWFHTRTADHAPELPATRTGRVLTEDDIAGLALSKQVTLAEVLSA
jgi:hypothetical protein